MTFTLHPNLAQDAIAVGRFALCRVLVINDASYPWFVLVPARAGVSDTIDLTANDHAALWAESRIFGQAIMTAFAGDKLNVASLGNITPQLHIHHIVRHRNDAAWPGPVWGAHPMRAYTDDELDAVREKLQSAGITGFESQ